MDSKYTTFFASIRNLIKFFLTNLFMETIYMRPLYGLLATYWPRFLVYITDI